MMTTHNTHVQVRPLTLADAETCDQIILSLPHHFGNEAGRAMCSQAVRTSTGWVAVRENRVVGFLTLKPHFPTSVEISWMAVHADVRGQGIGHHLIQSAHQSLQKQGYRLWLVATLAASHDEGPIQDGYQRTRAFYQSAGFLPAQEIQHYWGVGSSTALLLIMPL